MFINKILAACLLGFSAIAATAQSLKVVDVTDSVSSDEVITLKSGVVYDVASASENGYLLVQCPSKSSKKAFTSYIGASFDDAYEIDIYDPEGLSVAYVAGYDYSTTYDYALAEIVCYNGRIHSFSYSYPTEQ